MLSQPINQDPIELAPGQAVPTPPAPPPAVPGMNVPSPTARAIYLAKEQQREVLGEQLTRLLRRRENISEQLTDASTSQAERLGLEQHYAVINGRIVEMEKEIQRADAEWAAAAGVPGATTPPPRSRPDGPPEEMLILGTIFAGISLVIFAFAVARRILKGAGKVITQIPSNLEHRFTRLEQSIDTVAIEVERISEGQRFLTRVLGEQNPRAVGASPMQSVQARGGEAVPEGYRSL